MKSSLLKNLMRVAISVAALGLIIFFMRDKLSEAMQIIHKGVDWSYFGLSVLLYFVALVIMAFRIQAIFKVQQIHLSAQDSFYLNFLGLFFNLFFPSAVGGDVAKAYYAYKHSGKKIESTTAVILDRLMGFVALIIMAMFGVLVFSKQIGNNRIDEMVYGAGLIMTVSILFFGSKRFAKIFKFLEHLIPSEKWRARVADLYRIIYGYKKHVGVMFYTVGLSMIAQSFFVMVHYTTARSLGADMSPWLFFILVPILAIVSMAPSIGGLGVREAGVVYLFQHYMPSEKALALSILLDIIIYSYSIMAGIVFALKGGLGKKMMEEMEALQ